MIYYACAENGKGKIEQLKIVREKGKQVSQVWTGKIYSNMAEAEKDLGRLNSNLAKSPKQIREMLNKEKEGK